MSAMKLVVMVVNVISLDGAVLQAVSEIEVNNMLRRKVVAAYGQGERNAMTYYRRIAANGNKVGESPVF